MKGFVVGVFVFSAVILAGKLILVLYQTVVVSTETFYDSAFF